ncbi:MAG: hypothetical protein LUQ57_03135 [Methylococcaceae bacterium]|nr:hypothetical protein [Methylococcaceae bacterium]
MALFDSIAIEIQATVAGALILLIITLLEIIDLQRARKLQRQELHAISNGAGPAHKKRLVSLFSLSLQFIFGFVVFALFVSWMMYLIIMGKTGLAVIAGVFALVAVIMPFFVWSACRKANRERAAAIQNAERRRQQTARQEKIADKPVAQTAAARFVEEAKSVAAESVVIDPVPVAKPQPKPEPMPEVKVEVKPAVYLKPDPEHVFPKDAMLRRHFMTHLATTVRHYVPTRPSDSMLSRHYDAMLASQTVVSFAKKAEQPPVARAAKYSSQRIHQVKLPEDSMLRRHFLTTLQMKIESRLPLPARPTDSLLKRHFDAMKKNLVAAELNKYVEG